jgi:biopolymer transport protein ExbD
MHFKPRKHRRAPSVIIVSLIDVLLVVLIFLMVTTTAKTRETALKLALPESKQAKPGATTDTKPYVIAISTNFPFFFVENRPLTLDQLQKDLIAAAQKNPQVKVAIRADKLSPFGEVVKVIDAAKVAGAGSIDAITEKPAVAPQ